MKITLFVFAGLLASMPVTATYLDRPYQYINPPTLDYDRSNRTLGFELSRRSATESVIALQTPVKSQGKRGTCAIFSTTALLESMLIIKQNFSPDVDLSEEWLEYLAVRNRQSQGSDVFGNINLLKNYGIPLEQTWPYIGETWKSLDDSPLALERCQGLTSSLLKSCLLAHEHPKLLDLSDKELLNPSGSFYRPDFVQTRNEAFAFRDKYIRFASSFFYLGSVSDIKRFLNAGIPVVVGLDVFYEAWNHRKTEELGIERNWDHWYKGIVGFPEPGSLDYKLSPSAAAGHSVLIVGYDDSVVIERTVEMADGRKKTFTYQGVYYFKNSWGTNGFGRDFELNGRNYPGYGMITQDYAHNYGGFFHLPLR